MAIKEPYTAVNSFLPLPSLYPPMPLFPRFLRLHAFLVDLDCASYES